MKDQFLSFTESLYTLLVELFGYTHPVHPTQINMPIGLITGALLLGIAALLFKRWNTRISSRHCLILALLFLIPTVFSGIMDWQHFYGGVWLFAIKAKILLGTLLVVFLIWGILISSKPEKGPMTLLTCALAFCISVALGYFGGDIVFGARTPESKSNREGRIVFLNNCSGCHPYGGNILSPGEPVIRSPLLKTVEPFMAWIRNPGPPMPPFPAEDISDEQGRALHSYVAEIWGEHEHGSEAPQSETPSPSAPSTLPSPSIPDIPDQFKSPSTGRQV
ncbi:MAG: hypothetical protein C4576_15620 [Desulfobacteraceae bacterium]|nr:MAG: hypothetical protein C4576_15620 [Desulfobacteraceae bacterium]